VNPVSSDQNKRIVLDLIEGIDRCDFAILDRLCTPDLRAHFNGKQLNRGEIEAAARQFSQDFTGIKQSIKDVVAEGDRVVIRALDEATHTGDFRVFPQLAAMFAEVWEQMDMADLVRQIT